MTLNIDDGDDDDYNDSVERTNELLSLSLLCCMDSMTL